MRVYYGQGGSTRNRFGQKFKLLSARQRLARVVRAVIGKRDWHELPRGQADLALLRSQLVYTREATETCAGPRRSRMQLDEVGMKVGGGARSSRWVGGGDTSRSLTPPSDGDPSTLP